MTCEEYVTERLTKLEQLVDQYQERDTQLVNTIRRYENTLAYIKQFIQLNTVADSDNVFRLSMESIWSNYNSEEYETLKQIFDLQYREDALKGVEPSDTNTENSEAE